MARCNPDLVHAIIRNMCLPLSWPCTCWLSWTCTCYPRLATIWLCTCYLGLAIILTLYLLTRTCYYPDLTFFAPILALYLLISWPWPSLLLFGHCTCYYHDLHLCFYCPGIVFATILALPLATYYPGIALPDHVPAIYSQK